MATSTRLSASPRLAAQAGRTDSGLFGFLSDSPTPARPAGIPFPAAYDFFLNPWTPVVFGVAYFAITKTLSHYQDGKNRMQGKRWKAFVVIHNMILAVYSGWTFASTAPAFFGAFWRAFNEGGTAGLLHVLCDSDTAAWAATQFPYFAYTFYISKFYEVIDTAIILAKGKRVGMLQSYHHTGAIWTMFAGFRTGAFPIWIFVVFNSFIHTLMYIFYTCSALKIPFPTFLKKSLTKLQITQFLIGGSLAASYLFIQLPTFAQHKDAVLDKLSFGQLSLESVARMGTQCVVDQGQRAAVWLNVAYLIPLTYLFGAFFVKSYQAKSKAAQKKAKIASEAKAGGIKAE